MRKRRKYSLRLTPRRDGLCEPILVPAVVDNVSPTPAELESDADGRKRVYADRRRRVHVNDAGLASVSGETILLVILQATVNSWISLKLGGLR
jgi:hypothetical protein